MTQALKQLNAPFPADMIQWKAQTTSRDKTRALAVPYIDARAVMERLDEVFGLEWADTYKVLDANHVECTITAKGISKSDVGESNEGGFADKMKGAYSDAFKRAGVKWGVGRYLYSLPTQWVGYDGQRKQLTEKPPLPPWAIPGKGKPPAPSANSTPVTPEPEPAGPVWNVESEQAGNTTADMHAWLDDKARPTDVNGKVIALGLVADALVMTGKYNDRQHVKNALNLDDAPVPDGFEIDYRKNVTLEGALKVYDWAMARKEAE